LSGAAFTGRVASVTSANREIILDRETEAKAGDVLYITRKNGITEGRTVLRASGNSVTVSVSYTEVPQTNAVWYLESSDLKSQLFRVTKVTSPGNGQYEISGVEYNESKYGAIDNGARLETRPINRVPPSLQEPPASVTISSRTYVEQTMAVTTMVVSWPQTENATSYEVQWRVGDGDWVNLGFTGATQIEVKGIYAGNYTARVRARNSINVSSIWKVSALTSLAGKTGAPPVLASLSTTPMFFGIRLDWQFSPGSDDLQKTEIRYSETPNFVNSILLGDFSYPTDYHEMHGLKAGQRFWFWARTQDKTGNYSDWKPLSTAVGIAGNSLFNENGAYNDYLAEMINETMLDKLLYDRIELIDGPPSMPGSVNSRLETVNDRIDETNNNLNNAVADLEDQIANITDALVYDPTKVYNKGDIVRVGNKLYQAQQNVPINTTPPNITYWKDVGTILEDANAVVTQVNVNTQKIEEVDGKVIATANQITGLQAMWRDDNGEGDLQDALSGWDSAAKYGVEVKVRASEDEALAQRITSLSAEVGDNKASISTLEKVVATNNTATAERIDTLKSAVDSNSSTISTLEKTVTDLDSTTASSLQLVNSKIDNEVADRIASVGSEATTRANADEALGIRIDTTEASIGENTASIQQVESAQATLTETVATLSSNISSVYTFGREDDEGSLQDALGNWKTTASYGVEVKARSDENEAMTQRVETLRADFNTANATLTAGIQNEATVRATADAAMASQITILRADVNGNIAAIKNEETVRSTADNALGQRIDTVQVSVGDNASAIQSEATARANGDIALGQRIDTVQATAGENSAAIQTVQQAQATTDGKVNTSWAVKMEVTGQGQYVAAGVGLGIENGPAGLQSQFLVRADRFAVVNGIDQTVAAPFVVQGGQVFINDALINKATITNAMIGSTITSVTLAPWAGVPATVMTFAGEGALVMRNPSRANSYVTHTPQASTWVIDGVTRVRIGSW
jgi:predicted phage tail protein